MFRKILKSIIPKGLKSKLNRLILGYDVNTHSFSQAGEDAMLFSIFLSKILKGYKGFFVK